MNTSTTPTKKDFLGYSRDIVREFLQSVMVLDDQARFSDDERQTEKEAKPVTSPRSARRRFSISDENREDIADLEPLPAKGVAERKSESAEKTAEDKLQPAENPTGTELQPAENESENFAYDEEHQLYAKKVIDKFADNGIACAILRPSETEVNLEDKVKALSFKSDILVFDWVLGENDLEGKTVTRIITNIVLNDLLNESRLRLIAVYTGQSKLTTIIERLRTEIERLGKKNSVNFNVETPDNYTIRIQSIKICAFAKGSVKSKALEEDGRIIPNEDLPERLISEFTKMTAGLVSNAALKAFSVLRGETHRILSRYGVKLDPAFLAHRAMLKQPEDAGRLLSGLIGSDLTALLEEREVGKATDSVGDFDALLSWLKQKEKEGVNIRQSFENNNLLPEEEELISIMRNGVSAGTVAAKFGISAAKPHKAKLTNRFLGTKEETAESKNAESEFAVLTTFKPEFRLNLPTLVLGTVLKCEKEGTYWVCIQALCDCTRITSGRNFPLLPLTIVEDNQNFNFVIRESGKLFKVKVDFRPYFLRSEKFAPNAERQAVCAVEIQDQDRKKYVFEGEQENTYEWMGELRFAHAQRIANQFAVQISRVGLDESEWQRLWLPDSNG